MLQLQIELYWLPFIKPEEGLLLPLIASLNVSLKIEKFSFFCEPLYVPLTNGELPPFQGSP